MVDMHVQPAGEAASLHAACARCGQLNRVPAARIHDDPTCGRCKVDFWAPWCGPCRAVAPALEEIARRHASRLVVVKVNVDDNQELAGRYGVRSIPTMVVLRGGKEVDRMVGALPAAEIERRLARLGDR